MLARVPAILVDLLEVAAYVYAADSAIGRGGSAQRNLGQDWRRRLRFVIPVRNVDTWKSPTVLEALTETVSFLSDDFYTFDFVPHTHGRGVPSYLDFGTKSGHGFDPEEVVLFSGGLDSLAGAVEEVVGKGKRVVLVSHHSSTKILARQRHLTAELAKAVPNRLFHITVKVDKKEKLAHEFTLRSRSFLFASLAAVIGAMFGGRPVRFFENGIVSLNFPILPQVVGARATRTTHPRSLHGFGQLFSELLGERVSVDNPFAFKTKGEAIRLIEDRGCGDLIRSTISCTHVRDITNYKTHCGLCSQCLDRRFGTLSAGIEHRDPEEMYEIRLLQDARKPGVDRTMAEGYLKSAADIRRMTDWDFLGRFAGEMSRAIPYLPGDSDQNARAIIDLHRRHADAVFSVMEQGVHRFAGDLVGGTLPASSLLRIAVASDGHLALDTVLPRIENVTPRIPPDSARLLEFRLALDESAGTVLIEGLAPVEGPKTFAFFSAIIDRHLQDRNAGRAPERHGFVSGKSLAARMEMDEASVRKLVSRARKRISDDFLARYGVPLPVNACVENKAWKGYRLNPMVRVLQPSELCPSPARSRFPG
jgi:7-cyano-7-deazaguanine synthase in queuosine biosynthesis